MRNLRLTYGGTLVPFWDLGVGVGAAAGGLHRGGFSGGGEERVGVGGIVGVPSERSENRRHAGER